MKGVLDCCQKCGERESDLPQELHGRSFPICPGRPDASDPLPSTSPLSSSFRTTIIQRRSQRNRRARRSIEQSRPYLGYRVTPSPQFCFRWAKSESIVDNQLHQHFPLYTRQQRLYSCSTRVTRECPNFSSFSIPRRPLRTSRSIFTFCRSIPRVIGHNLDSSNLFIRI